MPIFCLAPWEKRKGDQAGDLGACREGCIQKAQSHYWGVKSFHTDPNFLVVANDRGDKPVEKHQEKKHFSSPLWPDSY